jgi:hypothetical protein
MKMYHFAAVGVFCLLLSVGSNVNAQSLNKAFSFGLGLEGGLAGGSANSNYHSMGGLGIRFSYHVGPGFVTLGTGAFAWVPKSFEGKTTKASLQVPVLAGYKFIFARHLFVMGELGYSSFRVYYNGGNGDVASTNYGGFTYAPSFGINFSALELGIRYQATSLSGATLSAVGLRLAFNF